MTHGAAGGWLKAVASASLLILAACAPAPTNFSLGDGTRASVTPWRYGMPINRAEHASFANS